MNEIIMRATYEEVWWEDGEEDPHEVGGYTDPHNPWGGFKSEVPPMLVGDAFTAWVAENVGAVTFTDLEEAAEFVLAFPGNVWDFADGGESVHDFRTGRDLNVCLHVATFEREVFEMAEALQERRAAKAVVSKFNYAWSARD